MNEYEMICGMWDAAGNLQSRRHFFGDDLFSAVENYIYGDKDPDVVNEMYSYTKFNSDYMDSDLE